MLNVLKNYNHFKSGQKWLENNHFEGLTLWHTLKNFVVIEAMIVGQVNKSKGLIFNLFVLFFRSQKHFRTNSSFRTMKDSVKASRKFMKRYNLFMNVILFIKFFISNFVCLMTTYISFLFLIIEPTLGIISGMALNTISIIKYIVYMY